jgi:hypothetical protein
MECKRDRDVKLTGGHHMATYMYALTTAALFLAP